MNLITELQIRTQLVDSELSALQDEVSTLDEQVHYALCNYFLTFAYKLFNRIV